jgi:hypothetical protein
MRHLSVEVACIFSPLRPRACRPPSDAAKTLHLRAPSKRVAVVRRRKRRQTIGPARPALSFEVTTRATRT